MTMLSAGFNKSAHWERSGEPGCRPVGILFLQFSTEIIVKKKKRCWRLLQIQKHLRYFTWRYGHWHSAQDVLTDKSSESLKKFSGWRLKESLKHSSSSSFFRHLCLLFLFTWSFSLIHVQPRSRSGGLMECDGQSSERSCQVVRLTCESELTWHQQVGSGTNNRRGWLTSAATGG